MLSHHCTRHRAAAPEEREQAHAELEAEAAQRRAEAAHAVRSFEARYHSSGSILSSSSFQLWDVCVLYVYDHMYI